MTTLHPQLPHISDPGRSGRLTRVMRLAVPVMVVWAAAVGCSGDDSASNATSDRSSDSVPVLPGTSDDYEGARSDISDEDCRTSDGLWQASGSVTNSTSDTRSYRIYVAFIVDGETEALRQVDVDDLGGGKNSKWSARAPSSVDGAVECILRVERYQR
jgi:hypothetical protein